MTDPSKQPDPDSSPDGSAVSPETEPMKPPTEATAESGSEPTERVPDVPSSSEAGAATDGLGASEVTPDAPVSPTSTASESPKPASPAPTEPGAAEQTMPIPSPPASGEPTRRASGSAPVRPTSPASTPVVAAVSAPSDSLTQPLPPTPPQPATPGYTEPIPGVRRPHGSRRGAVIVMAVIAVILLLLCGGVGYMFWQKSADDNAHKVGKCIERTGSKAKPVECGSPKAYKIIKRLNHTKSDSGCPASETELYFVNKTRQYVLCLKKNVQG
ncbi:MAG: LppU/SCO3897 family protein, partial [Mycobacteriales bacterium]